MFGTKNKTNWLWFCKKDESQANENLNWQGLNFWWKISWASDAMGNLSCPTPNWAFPMDECHGQKAVSRWLLHSPGQQGISSGAEMTQLYLLPCFPSLRIQFQPWLHIRINGEGLEILSIDWALADQWPRNPWGWGPRISSCKNSPSDSDGNCYP